jgi:hypothetical protein
MSERARSSAQLVAQVYSLGREDQQLFAPTQAATGRVSFAALDEGHPPRPMLMGRDGQVATVVVVWPTHPDGLLHDRWVANVKVATWRVAPEHLQQMEELHLDFPLSEHDVWVGGSRWDVRPSPHRLVDVVRRRDPALGLRLAEKAIHSWEALLQSTPWRSP